MVAQHQRQIQLREVADGDVPIFFSHLRDPQAAAMASITDGDLNERHTFETRWSKLLRDPDAVPRTIVDAETSEVLGHIIGFPDVDGEFRVSYWVDREHWGHGVATGALAAFLEEVPRRPIIARAPRHNEPAMVVLERNGFHRVGEESGYVLERGRVVDELIFRLP